MNDSSPLSVVIVGAGPSGFFAADALLKARDDVQVLLIDRLPTPYGLVRYGVAPDHPKIKSVTAAFERTCRDPRVTFVGNVDVGRDVTVNELREHADAVLLTVGASSDRSLGIAGEELPGSMSATEFVAWYNGHPDYVDRAPDLSVEHAAVVGMGNVAVDVARILAKSVDELKATDIADHALEVLAESHVKDITMLGRRGPAQAKWTTKELRELGELAHADIDVLEDELVLEPGTEADLNVSPAAQKNYELLQTFASKAPSGKPRVLRLRFRVSPTELSGNGRVESFVVGRNRLAVVDGRTVAQDSGERESWPAGLVLRSVGYRGVPLAGVPFDDRRGVIPNDTGRVLDEEGRVQNGLYVAGWIKRGPSGVIGTNKADALETVRALLEDIRASGKDAAGVLQLLGERDVVHINFDEWLTLDAAEQAAGAAQDRPRVKVTSRDAMLRAAKGDA